MEFAICVLVIVCIFARCKRERERLSECFEKPEKTLHKKGRLSHLENSGLGETIACNRQLSLSGNATRSNNSYIPDIPLCSFSDENLDQKQASRKQKTHETIDQNLLYDFPVAGINPANGLPMVSGVDCLGNPFGCDLTYHK